MRVVSGWIAIALALVALAPSIVPGAFSVFGLMISMLALILSLFSVKNNGKKYFGATTMIVLAGIFLINDGLRIWEPLPMPLHIKLSLYGIVSVIVVACAFIARRLATMQNDGVRPSSQH